MAADLIRFINVTGFLDQYIRNHSSTGGVANKRLCTLGKDFSTIHTDSKEFEEFVEQLELLMCDAPADGSHWTICAWIYSKGNICPVISHGDTGAEHIPLTIANHLVAMADSKYVTAFEVTFDDMNPSHRWLFLAK